MSDRDRRIRDEAYRIWVEAGRPEGGEQDHWLEAERRIGVSDGVESDARSKLKTPGAERKLKTASKDAAGTVAADIGKAEAGGVVAKEAEAFAKRRPGRKSGDVAGAAAAPAPGPAGAQPAMEVEKSKGAGPKSAKGDAKPRRDTANPGTRKK